MDAVTLWGDNARKATGKARVHGNLGKAYFDGGDYLLAREAFEKASLSVGPDGGLPP